MNPFTLGISSSVPISLPLLFQTLRREGFPVCLLERVPFRDTSLTIAASAPMCILRAEGDRFFVNGKYVKGKPYELLREHFTACQPLCMMGYFSFEAAEYFEPSVVMKADPRFGHVRLACFHEAYVYDHRTRQTVFVSGVYKKPLQASPAPDQVEGRLSPGKRVHLSRLDNGSCTLEDLGLKIGIKEYAQIFHEVQNAITNGDVFQCVIGLKRRYRLRGDPFILYERLRKAGRGAFPFFLDFGDVEAAGISPEILLQCEGREIATYPLAGSAPRGRDPKEDAFLQSRLLHDEKELAEHRMLVDLHRNDLGKVAVPGSVAVHKLMMVKRLPTIQHIRSEVTATLERGRDVFDALAATFPAGTLSGAPKVESLRLISRLERSPRGPYGGAVGLISRNLSTFLIPIRSFFAAGEEAYIQAGSGIVRDSTLEGEYAEIMRKMNAVHSPLTPFLS